MHGEIVGSPLDREKKEKKESEQGLASQYDNGGYDVEIRALREHPPNQSNEEAGYSDIDWFPN